MNTVWLILHYDSHGTVVRGCWDSREAAIERGIPACSEIEASYHGGDRHYLPDDDNGNRWRWGGCCIEVKEVEVQS